MIWARVTIKHQFSDIVLCIATLGEVFQDSLKRLCIRTVKPGNAIHHAKQELCVCVAFLDKPFMNKVNITLNRSPTLIRAQASEVVVGRRETDLHPRNCGVPGAKFSGALWNRPERKWEHIKRVLQLESMLQVSSILHQASREGTKRKHLSMLTDGSNARKRWLTANSRKLLRQRRTQPT